MVTDGCVVSHRRPPRPPPGAHGIAPPECAVSVERSRTLRVLATHAVDDLAVELAGVCDVVLPLPSGRIIAWSRYHGAQLVDLSTGPLGERIDDSPMACSPDGRELLLQSGRRARVTDAGLVTMGDRVALKDGFRAVYSPDGAAVITLGPNDGLRVFDLATGTPRGALLRVRPAAAKTRRLTCLAVLADGERVVVGDTGGSLYAVNLLSRKVIRAVEAHRGPVSALAVSPDGRHLASGGVDTTVRRWAVATFFASPTARTEAHASRVMPLGSSRDPRRRMLGGDGGAILARTLSR